VLVDHRYLTRSEGHPKAKAATTNALELDDTLAEAHTSYAVMLTAFGWDWIRAEQEFVRALQANPNYATAHHWYSLHLTSLGCVDEAFREAEIAKELDPLSPQIRVNAGICYSHARKYGIALEELDKALELDPGFVPAHSNRVWVYLAKSMFDEALAEQERVLPFLQPLSTAWRAWIGAVYAIAGRTEEAKRILRECEEASAHERVEDVNPEAVALLHLKLGNRDSAFEWLEKGIKARTITPFPAKLNPFFDEITSDRRFDKLLKKMMSRK